MTAVKQTWILIDLDTGIVATLVVITVLGWVSLRDKEKKKLKGQKGIKLKAYSLDLEGNQQK